jgi:hypothetical protein
MLGDGTNHHYQPRPTRTTPGTTRPARTPTLHPQTNHRPQTPRPRAHARARPAATRATTRNPRNPQPFKRPTEHAPTPPRANHAPRPRDRTTERETRSLPPLLASLAGRLNGGVLEHAAGSGYVASRMALPRHAQGGEHGHATTRGQLSTGRGEHRVTRTMSTMRARGHALAHAHAWSFVRSGRVGIRPPPRGLKQLRSDPGHPVRGFPSRARVKGICSPPVLRLGPLPGGMT